MRPFDQSDLSHVIDKSIKWFKLHRFLSGEYLLIVLRISHQTSRMSFRMCAHRIPAGAKVVKIDRIARRIEWTKTKATNCSCWHVFFKCFCCKKIWENHQKWVLEGSKKIQGTMTYPQRIDERLLRGVRFVGSAGTPVSTERPSSSLS